MPVGAHYIHGGVEAAQAMMGWLGCEVSVDRRVREEARTRSHGQLELLPESKVASLEALLKYKFQNRGLLVEALTHASCSQLSGDCNYQVSTFVRRSFEHGMSITSCIDNMLCGYSDWSFWETLCSTS